MTGACKIACYVVALLVCGSLNTLIMKIAFTQSGTVDGRREHFEKPWFITFNMFLAMSFALLFDASMWQKKEGKMQLLDGEAGIPANDEEVCNSKSTQMPWRWQVLQVMAPASFDILATGLGCIAFLYIPASVWQLLRGAELIFVAIFSAWCLQQRLKSFHYVSLLLAVLGILSVGLATLWGHAEEAEAKGSTAAGGILIMGTGIALASQMVGAAQVVGEEWLLKDVDLPGLQVIGFEGIWGLLLMLFLVLPAVQLLPGNDHGSLEDEMSLIPLLRSNPSLLGLMMLYIISCASYNIAGICVTESLSATQRVMLEALRTLIIWAFGLWVHHWIDPTSKMGEVWTNWSWLQVLGFVLLMLAQMIYNEMIQIPGVSYAKEDVPTPARRYSPVPQSLPRWSIRKDAEVAI